MNHHRLVIITLLIGMFFLWQGQALAAQQKVIVTGVGFMAGSDLATARDMAIRDAQVRAVEQAFGVMVDSRTALHKSLLVDDTVLAESKGIVRNYKVLHEEQDNLSLYRVRIEALVDTNTMTDKLTKLAGSKRLLMVRSAAQGKGDILLSAALARDFADAGFALSYSVVPEQELFLLDRQRIKKLAGKRGHDLVVALRLASTEPQCATSNFCAAEAEGFVHLLSGKNGESIAEVELKGMRGFGDIPSRAAQDCRQKAATRLAKDFFAKLMQRHSHEVKVVVYGIPDQAAYKALASALGYLRWVEQIEEDAVGFHPVKSVFLLKFVQDFDILSGMLGKLGNYSFQGRTGHVYSLKYQKTKEKKGS